jgi:multicomponent K+:H+ antiporter subunit E
MKRWLPFPLFSLALLAMWLVLAGTTAAAHVLLGAVLGIAGGRILARLPELE